MTEYLLLSESESDDNQGTTQALILFGITALLILLLSLGTSSSASIQAGENALAENWWNDRVFYEIFIRSFNDSDGDGIGDIQGIIDRLDYLNDGDPDTTDDLGITGIWLMPPAEAHSYHGYDVTDYYAVEQDYGSIDDMQRLIDEAHSRGIAVIIDMVVNHSSSEHPWFIASQQDEQPYTDWYIWEDDNPGYAGPWGDVAWHEADDRYYYGVFWGGMPDFNYRNDEVTQEMYNIATFWLNDIGVDGFRLDAIKHIIENGEVQENTPESRQWLTDYEAHLESVKPNSFTVGEIFNGASFIVARYVDEQAIDVGFDFNLSEQMITAAQRGSNRDIARAHRNAMRDYPMNQFATFLTNHDQNRLANQLLEDMNANKVAASLLLTGPGVPFIYYGEEIGMTGTKPDERIRTPMHWDDTELAGFTNGDSIWEDLQDPENVDVANVADQTNDPDSLLNHYRAMIHLRNQNDALQQGDLTAVDSSDSGLYAFLRHTNDQTLLVLINLGDEPISDYTLTLDESDLDLSSVTVVYGDGGATTPELNADGGFDAYTPIDDIAPYSTIVIEF